MNPHKLLKMQRNYVVKIRFYTEETRLKGVVREIKKHETNKCKINKRYNNKQEKIAILGAFFF